MRYRKALLAVSFLLLCAAAAFAAEVQPALVVLPIGRAKFLAGVRFDMEVELRGAKADEITVRIDGRNAAEFFGTAPAVKKGDALSSWRLDGASFTKPGAVKVEAEAKAGGKTYKKSVEYTVAAPAEKRAKNVILFIGDGMGLVSRQVARILSKGITEGKYNGLLEMELLNDGLALLTTSGYDSLVTDSANSASAYAT
ncbi:MAG: alkaline phosphatase, partial [Synergistaceae bacterium]|nr:alkaline phosphatase [Synergistaceae bacterium]